MRLKINNISVLFVLMIGVITPSYAQGEQEEVSRILLFLGRFHPLVLHLPIGALILTFFLDVVGRIRKDYPKETIKYALGFSAIFSIIACILGYFLSLEGGYEGQTLDIHLYVGILSALLINLLFYLSCTPATSESKIFLPVFIFSLISISVAGHYGSILTHGEDFITEYAKAPEKEKTIEVIDSLKMYDDVVFKILDNKCIQCHNNTKKKGDLNLIGEKNILKGGENGEVIKINNALESKIYTHPLLPINDDEHMPPEGKPQLTKDELWLIKYWIDHGANFKDYIGAMPTNDTLNKLLEKYLVFEKKYIPSADYTDILAVEKAGFSVHQLVPGESKLGVKYVKGNLSKGKLKDLLDIKKQVVELNLSNTALNDDMTTTLKRLENLEVLRLDNTQITDKSLNNIAALKHLKVLNLYNTQVSNSGIENLLKSIQPEQIFTWRTQIDKETAMRLQKDYDVKIHHGIAKGFVEITQLKIPEITPNNTLFKDSIRIEIKSKLKNVDFRYTLDGSEPDSTSTLYKKPILISKHEKINVKSFKKGWLPSATLSQEYFKIKHIVDNYSIVKEPDQRYPDSKKLFDRVEGSSLFRDGNWTGYLGYDINTTIDLGEKTKVNNVSVNCLENTGNWILFPEKLIVYASENKDKNFEKIGELNIPRGKISSETIIKKYTVPIENTETQYLKVVVQNPKKLPAWHPGAGNDSWIFVDEIILW